MTQKPEFPNQNVDCPLQPIEHFMENLHRENRVVQSERELNLMRYVAEEIKGMPRPWLETMDTSLKNMKRFREEYDRGLKISD